MSPRGSYRGHRCFVQPVLGWVARFTGKCNLFYNKFYVGGHAHQMFPAAAAGARAAAASHVLSDTGATTVVSWSVRPMYKVSLPGFR